MPKCCLVTIPGTECIYFLGMCCQLCYAVGYRHLIISEFFSKSNMLELSPIYIVFFNHYLLSLSDIAKYITFLLKVVFLTSGFFFIYILFTLQFVLDPLLPIAIIYYIVNFSSYIGILQVNAAAEVIYDLVDPTANLIFGAVIDPSLSGQVSNFLFQKSIISLIAVVFKLMSSFKQFLIDAFIKFTKTIQVFYLFL